MVKRYAALVLAAATALPGCRTPPGPVFPELSPPIVWPPPPDRPRIRYVGELRGEANLGLKPRGWDALRAAIAGPKPPIAFSRPSAVAVSGERVFVADIGLAVVHLLDLQQRTYRVLTGAPSDPLRVPIDLAIRADRELFVADRARGAIDIFDLQGEWRAARRWPELSAPVAVAWDASSRLLWLLDVDAHACFALAESGEFECRIGQRGSAAGQFNFPRAVAWHESIGLLVADAMNSRIQVFREPDRVQPAIVFGRKGDAAGDFAGLRDVAVDSEGHIYALDNQFENVQIFDHRGRLLMAFGRGGQGPGEFSLPAGITIDDRDRIWIADSYNHRVQVFQYLAEEAPWAG